MLELPFMMDKEIVVTESRTQQPPTENKVRAGESRAPAVQYARRKDTVVETNTGAQNLRKKGIAVVDTADDGLAVIVAGQFSHVIH